MRRPGLAIGFLCLAGSVLAAWWFSGAGPAWYLHRLSTRELVLRSLQDPRDTRVQLLLGERMEAAHSWDSAADAYQHAAADRTLAADAYAGLARVYAGEGNLALASRAADQAISANSRSAAALRASAEVALEQGNWLDARDRCQTLTHLNPRDGEAWEGLAKADLEIQRPALAGQALDRAEHLLAPSADLQILRGTVDLDSGNPRGAVPVLRNAVRLAPSDPQAWDYLGMAQMGSGDASSAERSLRRAQKLAPGAVPPVASLARLYEMVGKNTQAITMHRRVLELDPNSEASLYHLSQLLETTGQAAEAEKVRQQFVRTSDYHRTVVELQNRISRLTSGPLTSDRSAADPELAGLYRRLGLLHFQNHNWPDAVRVLGRARELFPEDVEVRSAYRNAEQRLQSDAGSAS